MDYGKSDGVNCVTDNTNICSRNNQKLCYHTGSVLQNCTHKVLQ